MIERNNLLQKNAEKTIMEQKQKDFLSTEEHATNENNS